jgi:dihydroorotate dehydrogenase
MQGYYGVIGPLLRLLPPETAHDLTVAALKAGLVPGTPVACDPCLAVTVWGRRFDNPIGLAAGFDKNAEVVGPMQRLGFGFVEVGTVTPRPQPGNPRPRMVRLTEDRAVVNRFGFNNQGLDRVAARLARLRRSGPPVVIGVNVGPNRDSGDPLADCAVAVGRVTPFADYVAVNVSSPNTPGLRDLQQPAALRALLDAVIGARRGASPPILVKLAPDLSEDELAAIAEVVLASGIDGVIATNTTTRRPAILQSRHRSEAGGLSGGPLFGPSTRVLAHLYRLTQGRLPLIGVGGISSGAEAYAKIRAGASLIQLYTALVYHGPGLVARILGELPVLLRADGFATPADAVGADAR